MNAIPLINNIPKSKINNETQLRQEINTSLVALKKEAGTLEGLINEAAQMLVTINNRIATLENDTVKKSDIVDVIQSGNMNPVTSNAVATSNAMPVNTVTNGDMHSVTSNSVYWLNNSLNSKIQPDKMRVFTFAGDGNHSAIKIVYSGNVQYCSIMFLVNTRYSMLAIQVELDGYSNLIRLKKTIFGEIRAGDTTVTLNNNAITIAEPYTWDTYTLIALCNNSNIWSGLSIGFA